MIGEHATTFGGKTVYDYQMGALQPPQTHTPRLRVDYDAEESATTLLSDLLQQEGADRLTGLVIGAWSGTMYDTAPTEIVEALAAAAGQLPSLTALFVGDIISEENEISWIHQTDVSPLWQAFPRLLTLQIRGSMGLSLGRIKHDHLQELILENGGLPKSVLTEISAAELPSLERLHVYLGTDNYGWDGTIDDVLPLLSGTKFPRLRHLGLCDSEIADEVAAAVAASPLLGRLESLDLSLGTLSDVGGEALLAAPTLKKLRRLDLHYHFLSDEVMEKLQALGINVDLSDQQEEEDYGRYVSIGE